MKPNAVLAILSTSIFALSLTFADPARAQKEITINSFKSSTYWPVWVAQHQGFFEKQGLVIKNVYTPNSTSQMVGLIKGEFDIVTTAFDNVVAYDLGDGSPQAPKEVDLITVMGGTDGANALIARPEIKTFQDLKGKDIAVDLPSTGYAYVAQEILAKNGLTPNDYKLAAFGNTGARWQALQDNKAAAGLLSPPVQQTAVGRGFTRLADAVEALGGYQGTVVATRRDYAKSNADVVVGFIRAYRQGLEWLKTPANKQQAIEILRAEIPETSGLAGDQAYDFLVANPKGFDPGGKLDPAGVKQVINLRLRYGPQGRPLTDAAKFIDESYYERATKP